MTARESASSTPALRVVAAYLVFATVLASWSAMRGDGRPAVIGVYVVLLAAAVILVRSRGKAVQFFRDWFPLLALPALYWAIPGTAIGVGPFDGAVQGWDRAMFGTDAARTFAGSAPWWPLSELLHAAYLSYYAIIYLPPLLMYLRGDARAFSRTVHAFAIAMVVCFAVFCLFPVEGPRYAWSAPAGVPDGVVRRMVNAILESGSSRGTAFPSSHQAIALVMGLSSLSWDRRLGLPVTVVSVLLGLGAVYGGFHYAVDMLAGAVVGMSAWYWVGPRGMAASA
jgi:membrane-associated phospholipid phosphatase